jgi:hypothetical protein
MTSHKIEYKFQDSVQTFAMLKESTFISAFAGFFIFGLSNSTGYQTKSFFKFNFCDFFTFFEQITQIVTFLGSSDIQDKNGDVLSTEFYNYKWNGSTVSKEINSKVFQEKFVTFFINESNSKIFELKFSIPQINNLFYLLSRVMFYTLCLKDIEIELLFETSKTSLDNIVSFKKDNYLAKQFVNSFVTQNLTYRLKKSRFVEILTYYNDLILIVHKLSLLSK